MPKSLLLVAIMLSVTTTMGCSDAASRRTAAPATGHQIADGLRPAGMYRLTEEQYRNTIADVFGSDIAVPGRFEPVTRRPHGLLAPGSYLIAASPSATEQYAQMARAIAGQVTDQRHRTVLIPCQPQSTDEDCVGRFFRRVGRYLFRRPLTDEEAHEYVRLAQGANQTTGDFYTGIALSLEAMLVSPQFLFQLDFAEPDPIHPGQLRLTEGSKASRLSFFLWNSSPDDELLSSAEHGDLDDPTLLAKQVDRLLASPRLEAGVRAFFTDMLELNEYDDVSKDAILYPQFIPEVRKDIPEQTLRTITYLLLKQNRDYRELFTTRQTFMSPALAAIYDLPFSPELTGWVPYVFPPDSPRAGLITQLTFLSQFSHPGRSSPTERGKALRELLLCQAVPDPPGNVDFTAFEKSQTVLKTARERLTAHRTNPVCAGCHRITDPIGLTLENFDAIGEYRPSENGAPIDASATVEGVDVKDAVGLGKAIAESPAATSCLVDRLVEYGTRQAPYQSPWLEQLKKQFGEMGYRAPELLRAIAVSDDFYSVHMNPTAKEHPKTTTVDARPAARGNAKPIS